MSILNNTPKDLIQINQSKKVGIAISHYHKEMSEKLYQSCVDTLVRHGIEHSNILTIEAPGCFELPYVSQKLIRKNCDIVISIGILMRGETSHFDHIADAVAQGLIQVSLNNEIPVIFGVLTVNNLNQAKDRVAEGKRGDKGVEAALSALEMLQIDSNRVA